MGTVEQLIVCAKSGHALAEYLDQGHTTKYKELPSGKKAVWDPEKPHRTAIIYSDKD